ncbi:lipoate--protein ligase family protein [Engelhardtia mirabilis]|uniref:Octanoyltransferase LipM n=1 Tax=Engelhardtia mirabilis TaxID=2528011 RepID=A0A518BNS7_9BACT|nr:Octanoyltransferase LipM [Planctomycetes bacterium Pla133]QDV02956.1 Octanoyltransferase LipM [Planctomycetes bacterium Pla86]
MAADAALLVGGCRVPTLRLYTWEPCALSLGYFQRVEDVPEAVARRGDPRRPLIRRRTGGGAIHHASELTFSIAADADHPLYTGPIAESYQRVHRIVATALAQFGVSAQPRGERELVSDVAGTGMCFHASHPLDLVWETPEGWAKGVGSAQRRSEGRVLHHGSIKLGPDPLEPHVATVAHGGGQVEARELGAALIGALAAASGVTPMPGELTAAELAQLEREARAFAHPAFTGRR